MHKVDEHGVGGEDADGLVDKGGEGAPLSRLTATAPLKGSLSCVCTSQQILDTNHKKFYNQTLSVSQLHFHNATHDIEWASDSLMNKQDAAH